MSEPRSSESSAIDQRDRARTILIELRANIAVLEIERPECAAASAAVVD